MKKQLLVLSYLLVGIFSLNACAPNEISSLPDNSSSDITSTLINKEFSSSTLELLADSLKVEGKYNVNGFTHNFTSIFTPHSYYNAETYVDDKYPEVVIPVDNEYNIIEENGKCYALFSTIDNKEKRVDYPASFDTVANPFKRLTLTDFTYKKEGVFDIDLTKSLDLIAALTNWNHVSAKSVTLTLKNDVPSSIKAVMETKFDGDVTYEMILSDVGNAKTPSVIYETKPEHALLKTAMGSFDVNNYQIHVTDTAYSEETDPVIKYDIYKTDKIIYNDLTKTGAVKRNDGTYRFGLVNNVPTLDEKITDNITPFDYYPTPTFAPELFNLTSEGRYSLINPFLAPLLAPYVAIEENLTKLNGNYGMDLDIFVKDNNFAGIEFNYNVQTLYANMKCEIINNGTTILPDGIDFDSLLSNDNIDVPGKIPTYWQGTYNGTCSQGTINGSSDVELIILENGVKINGVDATNVEYVKDLDTYIISLLYKGQKLFISNTLQGESDQFSPFLYNEDYSLRVSGFIKVGDETNPDSPIVGSNIPSTWQGTYKGSLSVGTINGETNITVVIGKNSVSINGEKATEVGFRSAGTDSYISFKLNGIIYSISNMSYDESEFKPLLFVDDYSVMCNNFIKQ